MNIPSIIILIVIAVWFALAIRNIAKNKGCSCGCSGSSCKDSDNSCNSFCLNCSMCGSCKKSHRHKVK